MTEYACKNRINSALLARLRIEFESGGSASGFIGVKPQTRRADLSSVQLLPSLNVEMAHPSALDA